MKDKFVNAISVHPKLLIFGVGLVTAFVIGAAIGLLDSHHAFALVQSVSVSGHDNDFEQELKMINDLIFS